MFETTCHCENIRIKASVKPESVTSCNCSLCFKIGALWVYLTEDDVFIKSDLPIAEYQWGQKLRTYHFCSKCGCTTHYTQKRDDGTNRVAINARMADSDITQLVPVKIFDGANTFKYVG